MRYYATKKWYLDLQHWKKVSSFDLERHGELEYDDGSSEPNTSNHLVMVYHYVCQDCGDITPE